MPHPSPQHRIPQISFAYLHTKPPTPPRLLVRPGWALSPSQGGLRQPSVTTPPWHEHEAPLTSSPSFSSVSSPLSCSFGRFLNASFSGLGESRGGGCWDPARGNTGMGPPKPPFGKISPWVSTMGEKEPEDGAVLGGWGGDTQVPRFCPGGFG